MGHRARAVPSSSALATITAGRWLRSTSTASAVSRQRRRCEWRSSERRAGRVAGCERRVHAGTSRQGKHQQAAVEPHPGVVRSSVHGAPRFVFANATSPRARLAASRMRVCEPRRRACSWRVGRLLRRNRLMARLVRPRRRFVDASAYVARRRGVRDRVRTRARTSPSAHAADQTTRDQRRRRRPRRALAHQPPARGGL